MTPRQAVIRSLPWLALVLVAGLAFTQMGARRRAERALAEQSSSEASSLRSQPPASPAEGSPVPGASPSAGRLPRLLRPEFDRAALEAVASQAEADRLAAQGLLRRCRRELERTQAQLDVARALAEVGARQLAQTPPASAAPAQKPRSLWVQDLRSTEADRRQRALDAAADASDPELLEVAERPRDGAESLGTAIDLVVRLKGHDLIGVLSLAVLEEATHAEAQLLMRAAAIGPSESQELLAAALVASAWRAAQYLLPAAAAQGGQADAAPNPALQSAVRRALAAGDPEGCAAAAVARLGLPGHGAELLQALAASGGASSPARLAALLHALARVGVQAPDAAGLRRQLAGWLAHPDPAVALAALLLAERLLGRALELDPYSPVAERAQRVAGWADLGR